MKPSAAATAPPSDEYDEQAYYRQVRMRRRKLLYVFLLFASLAMLAIFLELFLLSLRKEIGIENLDRFGQAMIVALLATLVTYLWARRDSNAAAFFFLSVCVAIATFIDSPREVTAGRSLISSSGVTNPLPRPVVRARGTRSARPVRRHVQTSYLRPALPWAGIQGGQC